MNALIVVDVQKDFLPGGALGVDDGDKVIPVIKELAPYFDFVIITADWHPKQTQHWEHWPMHAIAGTPGSDIHPEIRALRDKCGAKPWKVLKGETETDDGYSAFEGRVIGTGSQPPDLATFLRDSGVEQVTVTGLALDYCVLKTALDAHTEGFRTIVPLTATRPVEAEAAPDVIDELTDAGVKVTQ